VHSCDQARLAKAAAAVGEKRGLRDAALRLILNHTSPKTNVLHRHYVGLTEADVVDGLVRIHEALIGLMLVAHQRLAPANRIALRPASLA